MAPFDLSKLFSLGLLSTALLGAAGCNSDYALYKVHPMFSDAVKASDRGLVEKCRLVITDDKGGIVLNDSEILKLRKISSDSNNDVYVGCSGGSTPKDLGVLSYSSSLTTGRLTFTVEALDNVADHVIFSGSTTENAKVFANPKSDEITVDISLTAKH
jgi:hypothetical protein